MLFLKTQLRTHIPLVDIRASSGYALQTLPNDGHDVTLRVCKQDVTLRQLFDTPFIHVLQTLQ